MNDACMEILEEVFSNPPPAVKCAIIYGEGKHFSAGVDLSELREQDDLYGRRETFPDVAPGIG